MPLTPDVAQQCAKQIVAALNVPNDLQSQASQNWEQVVNIILQAIVANAIVMPTMLIAPPGTAGGPVVGTGTVT